jgi:hypothetical protein
MQILFLLLECGMYLPIESKENNVSFPNSKMKIYTIHRHNFNFLSCKCLCIMFVNENYTTSGSD